MGVNFATWVYGPCFDTFARTITYTPLISQPGNAAFQARGIFDTNERDVLGLDDNIFTDAKTELDIFMPEWSILPLQGDQVDIPWEDDVDGGTFVVSDVQGHGNAGGELTLTLQRIVPLKSPLPMILVSTGTFYVDSPEFARPLMTLFTTPPVGISASNYSVGHPSFATPSVSVPVGISASSYFVGHPSFATPSVGTGLTPTWARVQGARDTAGSLASKTVFFAAPVTSGNIVVGGVLVGDNQQLTNITDDKGNIYLILNSGRNPGDGTSLSVFGFRSQGPITNGPISLTYTLQGTSSTIWNIQEEFSAAVALGSISEDGMQLVVGRGVTTTPAFATLGSNDLLWNAGFSTAAATTGSGWTAGLGSGSQQMSEWKQVASPGSSNVATWATQTGQIWATVFGINASPRTKWALRQNAIQRSAVNTTTGSVTLPRTVASGNIVIGSIAVGTNGNVSDIISIVDDKGNNYPILAGYPNTRGRAIFWSGGPLTNGPKTITCTTSVTETVIYFLASEFILPAGKTTVSLDGTPAYTTAGSDPVYTSPTLTTAVNGSLIYSFADLNGSGCTPNNGFWSLNGSGMTWCDAFLVQTAAGAISAQWLNTGSGAPNVVAIAGFKAS